MKWFKHDSSANMDAKLKRIRAKYGMEGYGVYWFCLELIAQNIDKHNLTFELEHDSELISIDTGIHYEVIQEMMQEFIKLRLFENKGDIITCLKMATRTDEYTQKVINSSKVVPTLPRQPPDKVRLNRTEQNRTEQKKNSRFTPPTLKEIKEYCKERKNDVDPQKLLDHYEANGWVRGKTKIKSWKACVRTWEKPEGKGHETNKPTRAKRVIDKLEEIARNDIEENGYSGTLD